MSLRKKIILGNAAIIVLFSVIVLWMTNHLYNTMDVRLNNNLYQKRVTFFDTILAHHFMALDNIAQHIITYDAITSHLKDDAPLNIKGIQALYKKAVPQENQLNHAFAIVNRHHVMQSIIGDHALLNNTIHELTRKTLSSGIPTHGLVKTSDNRLVLLYNRPVYHNNTIIGAAVIAKDLNALLVELKSKDYSHSMIIEEKLSDQAILSAIQYLAPDISKRYSTLTFSAAYAYQYHADNYTYNVELIPVQAYNHVTIGHVLLMERPSDSYSNERYILNVAYIIIVLATIAAISLLYIYLKHALRPLRKAIHKIGELCDGDAYLHDIHTQDEIEDLFRSLILFEEYTEKIRKLEHHKQQNEADYRKHLEEYSQELEQEVNERTKEFKKAKDAAELANDSKSEFLSNMSHELRTPMHAILNYSRMGLKWLEMDDMESDKIPIEKLIKYLTNIRISGNRLMDLLNDLLDLSKMEAGKLDYNFEENDIVGSVALILTELESLFTEKNLEYTLTQNISSPVLYFDSVRIKQVLVNLSSNAINYSPENSMITIELHDTVITHHNKEYPALQCNIMDEGIGIPEGEVETIFNQFIQSSHTNTGAGGTGLGLSICTSIIASHQGKIWASNLSDKGACLSFIIPRQPIL